MRQPEWQKIKEVFALVVEQPKEQRPELLHHWCADDKELRAEIESLLAAHDDTKHLIEPDAYGVAAAFNSDEAEFERNESYEGKSFGRYRIVREIGRGGMGAVFLAERADGEFQQQVALKIVRRSFADRELARRFRRERQILATLNHPNIAHLLDGGVSADGEPFLVMEYVEGTRIDEYCEREKLSTRNRLKLFLQICHAVAYAHAHLIIHRDLKPSNILVNSEGVPKLLDFGIAKLLDHEQADEQTHTDYRAFTPDYASPEQISGAHVTTASDVYSLGVLLAVLLGETARAAQKDRASGASLVRGQSNDSKRQTGETNLPTRQEQTNGKRQAFDRKSVTAELQNIVCMARHEDPARRYHSAAEFAQDIGRYLDGLPVHARRDRFGYRAAKFVERRKSLFAATLFAVFALFAGISIANFYAKLNEPKTDAEKANATISNQLTGVKTIAVLPLKSLSNTVPEDSALRVGLADAIVTKLSQLKQLAVRPVSATVRYLDQDYDATAVGRELRVDSVLEGSVQREANELRINLQMVNVSDGRVLWADSFTGDMSNVLRGQESIAMRVSRLLALNLDMEQSGGSAAQSSANLAAQGAYLNGNYALTTSARKIENIFAARDYFEQAIRLDQNFAQAHAGLALTYTLAASLNLLSPHESYPKAERAARRALLIDRDLSSAYIALGEIESDYNWNWQAAETNYRRALELAPNNAAAHHSYSEFLARMGRFAESAQHSDLAQQLDPTRVNYEAVRALHYFYEHRFDDTIRQSENVIAKDANAYLAYLYLSIAHAVKGNYTAGIAAGEKAGAISGGDVPDLFVSGCNYALKNDRAKTNEILNKLKIIGNRRYVDSFHFVTIYAYLGDKEKAFEYLKKSYAEKSYWMTSIKVHPVVDSLRSDARFTEMLRKMNLEE